MKADKAKDIFGWCALNANVMGDNPIFSCQEKNEEIVKSITYRTTSVLGIPVLPAPSGTF